MNPQTIGKIDRGLGKPLCALLTGLRYLGRVLTAPLGRSTPPPVKKILFIKMIEQGATVLAYRALQTAVDRVGRENVYFWVFEENRPILDLLNVIPKENVIIVRAKKPVRLMLDLLMTMWKVRQMKFDASVDMEFYSRASAILAFLGRAKRRVGLHRFTSEGPYRGNLLTHRIQYNPYLHTAQNYYLMVEAIWADPTQTPMPKVPLPTVDFAPPAFVPKPGEVETVRQIVDRLSNGKAHASLVLLNPNASDLLPLRKWPTERFVELGKQLLAADPNVLIAITGAPSEAASAREVSQTISTDRCICLAGETTLRQLMVLYAIGDVLVTNDSGPGHFSSMTDIETLVLFGPETPALYGPLGHHTNVIWQNLACSPCVNVLNHRFSPCNDNQCMKTITVEQVKAKVLELLVRRRNGIALPVLNG